MASAASPPPKSINIPAFTSPDPFSYMSRPTPQFKSSSPSAERRSLEGRYILDAHTSNDSANSPLPAIRIRHLSKGMTPDALTSMLLFAEDFIDATFTSTDEEDDTGFLAAIARFRTPEAAEEARSRLNGKVNPSLDATLIVEMMPPYGPRGSEDSDSLARSLSSTTRSPVSNGKTTRPASRFNSTFQSMGGKTSGNTSAISESQGSNGPSSVFDATSPRSSSFGEHFRVSGKSVIGGDADDDTGEILRDPVAYAKSGQANLPRRQPSTSQQQPLPISRLANLTLNTETSNSRGLHISPPSSGYRGMAPLQSPTSEMSPTNMRNGMAPANNPSAFPLGSPHIQRHHYPPANPADQNPPCNTLYVGNLPMDTSEDELKAVFSKQRGYKRLCFRTKHNGPMCFVEFEDISFATKALNELYGHPLHNSVKGGIRLSFSKNPLGVRSGQGNSMGPNSPLTSPTGMSFGNLGAPPGFSTANGPPPGLSVPPGLSPPISTAGMTGFFNAGSPPSMGSTLQGSRGPGQFQSPAHNPQSPIGSGFPDGVAGR